MGPWDFSGFGPHHGPRRGRRFERGDLKYIILDLLKDRPSYGYEIIRALESRFHGFYAPSPGTVYPTLQWLEDLGYVTVEQKEGRKVYTITEEGRRFLAAQEPAVEEARERMRGWWGPWAAFDPREVHDLMHELRNMAKDLGREARWMSPDKMRRVNEVMKRAMREVSDIVRERDEGTRPATGGAPPEDSPGRA
jgi:DNA-binding PadR family transcriptional regulator